MLVSLQMIADILRAVELRLMYRELLQSLTVEQVQQQDLMPQRI